MSDDAHKHCCSLQMLLASQRDEQHRSAVAGWDEASMLRDEVDRLTARMIDAANCIAAALDERDAARAEREYFRSRVADLEWLKEAGCENTPMKGCECPGCGLARDRAESGVASRRDDENR